MTLQHDSAEHVQSAGVPSRQSALSSAACAQNKRVWKATRHRKTEPEAEQMGTGHRNVASEYKVEPEGHCNVLGAPQEKPTKNPLGMTAARALQHLLHLDQLPTHLANNIVTEDGTALDNNLRSSLRGSSARQASFTARASIFREDMLRDFCKQRNQAIATFVASNTWETLGLFRHRHTNYLSNCLRSPT